MDIFKRRKLEQAGGDGAAGGGGAGGEQGQGSGGGGPQNLLDTASKGGAGGQGDAAGGGNEPPAEWFWSDGVKGTDKPPDWFDHKKYKSVAEQARAYGDASKKLGELGAKLKGFKGAPEKYDFVLPDDLKDSVKLDEKHPLLGDLQKLARDKGMDQETFTGLLHTWMKYEYAQETIDLNKEKEALGERADERLVGFHDWASANLSEEQVATVMGPLGKNSKPSDVFKAFEVLLQATRQPALSKPNGDDTRSAMTQNDWNAKWYAKSEMKGFTYKIDEPGARAKARAELAQIVGDGNHVEVVGKRKAS